MLSCLCKVQAIVLPILLLLLDWFTKRSPRYAISTRNIFNQLPFFCISIIFGLIGINARGYSIGKKIGELGYSWYDKLVITLYKFFWYPFKYIFPKDLACTYYYPKEIPFYTYILPILFVILIIVLVRRFSLRPIFGICLVMFFYP